MIFLIFDKIENSQLVSTFKSLIEISATVNGSDRQGWLSQGCDISFSIRVLRIILQFSFGGFQRGKRHANASASFFHKLQNWN